MKNFQQENITQGPEEVAGPPRESYSRLFFRFLRFGCLAWGGPVAQIDMIRQELVKEEKWVSTSHFKKVLAIYQVLPGPEAHELCVYFGMLARGRIGGILAGLGFMLPGFLLMLLLSWLYVTYRIIETPFQALFMGIQPAVIALILRASHRIGSHVLTDQPAIGIMIASMVGDLLGIPFWVTLPFAGLAYLMAMTKRRVMAVVLSLCFLAGAVLFSPSVTRLKTALQDRPGFAANAMEPQGDPSRTIANPSQLFASGLRGGLLTFGGAYTAIPFIQRDAVEKGRWMSNPQFLDGIALSGTLPAPLVIFSTFVGYIGGGFVGAILMTLGMFLPAFSFSLLFHSKLESMMERDAFREFLEGVTAGVVGIIVSTLITLAISTLVEFKSVIIFLLALPPLYLLKNKGTIPLVILGSGILGWLLFRILPA